MMNKRTALGILGFVLIVLGYAYLNIDSDYVITDYDNVYIKSEDISRLVNNPDKLAILVFNDDLNGYINYGRLLKGIDSHNSIDLDNTESIELTDNYSNSAEDKRFIAAYNSLDTQRVYKSKLLRDSDNEIIGVCIKRVKNNERRGN